MDTFKIGDKVMWMRPKRRGGPIVATFMGYAGRGWDSAVIDTEFRRTTVRIKSLVHYIAFEVRS